MATVYTEVTTGPNYWVRVFYDDTNGAISSVSWHCDVGHLDYKFTQVGKQDLTGTVTGDGSTPIPAGYNLTRSTKGDWAWVSTTSAFQIRWRST